MLQIPSEKVPIYSDEHGTMRVGSTRVSLMSIVTRYDEGDTVSEIHEAFPTLELADIHAVIAYYLRHRDEVSTAIQEERQRGQALREETETEFPDGGLREKLVNEKRSRQGNQE